MTTQTAEVATQPKQEQLTQAESKRAAWGQLGVNIFNKDLEFQARAQASIAKLIIPSSIEEVAQAEAILKEVKAEGVALKNDRLAITRPVDTRIAQLTIPEKSFDEPTKKVEQAIIVLKKAEEARKQQEYKRLDELKQCREYLTTIRNNAESKFKQTNIDKVAAVYSHALGKGDISADMVTDYIKFAVGRRDAVEFDCEFPKNTYQLVKDEEFKAMCQELLIFDSKRFINEYENQLKEKFSDYAVALKNKAQALANAEKEKKEKEAAIESEKNNANIAAKLESVATPVDAVLSTTTKALKQSYAIDMPETVESMIAIMTAFTAHINLCMPKLNVSKWFSFTPSQAGAALAKVKGDDESFKPAGITFKVVDKL